MVSLSCPPSPPFNYHLLTDLVFPCALYNFIAATEIKQLILPILDEFTLISTRPTNMLELMPNLFYVLRVALPSTGTWVLGFYVIFHVFLNLMAEV